MTPRTPAPFPPVERIYPRLTEFVGYLRRQGVPVGVGGEVDLSEGLRWVSLLHRAEFREVCRITLAKSPEELRRVDDAFELFWSLNAPLLDIPFPGESTASARPLSSSARAQKERRPWASEREPPSSMLQFGSYSANAPAPGHLVECLPGRKLLAVRRGARRFRHAVATLPGRRRVRAHRGLIDFPRTFRHNLRHGGEWVEFRHHEPQLGRAELVLLWDVSGSMREHDSRLFALVHALVRVARSSRVFAFSTRVEEITGEVRRYGYARAAARVGARIDRAEGGTRIGPCLAEFTERFGRLLRPSTTVVILSDGWDLGETDLLAERLRWIARRTDLVVWVNPYARQPGFSPATEALRVALPHTDLLLAPEDFESVDPLRRSWGAPSRLGAPNRDVTAT